MNDDSDSSREILRIADREIEIKNADKLLFPRLGLTKRALIEYYGRIAPTALSHYRNRPLTMHRFPDGIGADGFYQKERPAHYPDWIRSASLAKENGRVEHVLVNDAATIVYLANQACITFHLALSRIDRPRHPDRLVFDLDPSDDDFGKVRSAAKRLKTLLDSLTLTSFVQTTGSRGLHVVVPLNREARFDRARRFARRAAETLAESYPADLTTEHRKRNRGNAVYIDYLRNAYGQTAVAPYSVRALEQAPVATPLRWDEIDDELQPRSYTVSNIFRRLGQVSDPWTDIFRYRQSLNGAEAILRDQAASRD